MTRIYPVIRVSFFNWQLLFPSLLCLLLTNTRSLAQITASDFVTTWKTDADGSGSNQIVIPAYGEYTVYYESIPAGIAGTLPETGSFTDFQTIAFPVAGRYRVAIKPTGSVPFHRIDFNSAYDYNKFLTIEQWGTTVWSSMFYAYSNCAALTTLPEVDMPVLSGLTNMNGTFYACTSLTGSSNMNGWDVSSVNDMNGLFEDASSFNQPLGNWIVGNVTDMRFMFSNATAFNQPIDSWNVSSVTTMYGMFNGASSFNQPLGNWIVGNVTDMRDMFNDAIAFNQPIDSWNVSNVTTMRNMFGGAVNFNQPLGSWNVTNVTTMRSMFEDAVSFNQPLNSWNISNVTTMLNMFNDATAFNQPLNKWTFNSAAILGGMLSRSGMDCGNYNSTLIGWAANPATPSGRNLGAAGKSHGPPAVDARNVLSSMGWTISGDNFDASCTSLPVTLVSFEAKTQELSSLLTWSTTEETNSERFEIQRSADAQNWKTIGIVASNGESKILQTYQFTDLKPVDGVNYYRLRMVDRDNTFAFSRIETVKFSARPARSIYPNPASNSVTVSGKTNGYLKIYNLSGREVMQTEMKTEKTSIPISGLPAGSYVIKSDDGWNSKFLKN